MDRARLDEELRAADAHIATGREDICRQREIVAELRTAGHDTSVAYRLLLIYEEAQAMHLLNRQRLARQIPAATFIGKRPPSRPRALAA
jgi:hypothetical protein